MCKLPKVAKYLGFIELRHAVHVIGVMTWLICLTEMYFFSKYFQGENRAKITYLAVGLAGYCAMTPAMSWLI